MNHWLVVCAFLFGCAALPAEAEQDQWVQYLGTATLGHSARFAYGERHLLRLQGNQLVSRVVLYQCGDGSAFARKTVDYVDPAAPDFLFEDASNGMREGVRSGPQGRVMLFRANFTELERTALLPRAPGLVIDAGFDEYIRSHWQDLVVIGPQPISFLVPSRQQRMSFNIEHLRHEQIEGTAAEVFRMKLNGVLGWVLPGIDVAYGAQDRGLLLYDGLSDLRDVSGNNLQVHVVFHPSDRKAADAITERAARGARLAPCH